MERDVDWPVIPNLRQQGGGKTGDRNLVVPHPAVPHQVRPGERDAVSWKSIFSLFFFFPKRLPSALLCCAAGLKDKK